jgi:hypothetical protein
MLAWRVTKMAPLKGGRMKPAYCYAPDTGEFTAEITAQPSPLEPGNYLLPASATFDPPPKPGTHESAVLRDGRWATVPDWRGIDLFSKTDGERTKIEELGLTPDDAGLTDKPRPSPAHCWKNGKWVEDAAAKAALLEESRAQCRTAIKAERDRRKAGGVLFGEKWFHSDADSRMQHLQLKDAARDCLEAGGRPDDVLVFSGKPVSWKTMDGSFVAMTARLATELVRLDRDLDAALFAAAEAHIAAMAEADDPSSYGFSGGWPQCCEG